MDRITACRNPLQRISRLKKAYYLSMRLGLIYHLCKHKDTALTRLARWYDEVDRSGFLAFSRGARSIQTHYLEIINLAQCKNLRGKSDKFIYLLRNKISNSYGN